jgi:spore germination cell wall hydrolase CwlJ-like protein
MNGLPSAILISLTLMGEARSEGETGMRLVAGTIWHRAATRRPIDLAAAATDPDSYSCWRTTKPSVKLMRKYNESLADARAYEIALKIANEMVSGEFKPLNAATHYCRIDCDVSWRSKLQEICRHRDHIFYREEKKA